MKTLTLVAVSMFFVLLLSSFAGAVVITFDDIALVPGENYIQNGYGGLNWDNFAVTDPIAGHYENNPNAIGWINGIVSPNTVAYNAFADPAYVRGADFDFIGAFFTAGWNVNNTLTIEGYNHGVLVGATTTVIHNTGPLFVAANLLHVDEVKFSTTINQFAMDNAEFTVRNLVQTPEPSILMMFSSGLLAAALLRKKLL
jgi:hypothetical protein